MRFLPPGLDYKPDDTTLAGFRSLMPKSDPKPSLLSRIVRAPFKALCLPFRALKAVLGLPLRLFGLKKKVEN